MKQTTRRIIGKAVLETLEDRQLNSAVTFEGGVLNVTGAPDKRNTVIIDFDDQGSVNAYVTDASSVTVRSGAIRQINITTGDQADNVYINPRISAKAKINTLGGNDSIVSGAGADVIDAGDGDDLVYGSGGSDKINGGDGNDELDGGAGNDSIDGDAGKDIIHGRKGNDKLDGGEGNDRIYGDVGNDKIDGSAGHDYLEGGLGNDLLDGGLEADSLYGNAGNDKFIGVVPLDLIVGGTGRNKVSAPVDYQDAVGSQTDTADSGNQGGGNTGSTGNSGTGTTDSGNTDSGTTDTGSTDTGTTDSGTTDTGSTDTGTTDTGATDTGTTDTGTTDTGTSGTGSGTGTGTDTGTGGATDTGNGNDTVDTSADAPVPVITALQQSIMAGQAFHVHALSSAWGAGSEIDARIEWDFGDTGSKYNNLTGFNAAHFYSQAGQFTITLKITNSAGKSNEQTFRLNVAADTRKAIYVSSTGNDANTGASPSEAVRSIGRVNQLISDNTAVYFQRGGTFDITSSTGGIYIGKSNVVIGAFGSGNAPIIRRSGTVDGGYMISMNNACSDVVVQDLVFTSVITTDNEQTNRPSVIAPRGKNITVRNITVHNVGYVVSGLASPQGVLVQDNASPDVTGMSGYLVWSECNDVVIIGNKVANSTREHIVRSSSENTDRMLVAFNDFANIDRSGVDSLDQKKTTINIRAGHHVYIAGNTLTEGTVAFGPTVLMLDSNTATSIVVENNKINDAVLKIGPNSRHVMIRNNVLNLENDQQIQLQAWLTEMPNRYVEDITIMQNTGLNFATGGKFLKVEGHAHPGTITLISNLFIAPNLAIGQNFAAALDIRSSDLSGFKLISHNIWPAQKSGAVNYVFDGLSANGYVTSQDWNDYTQVQDDVFMQIGVQNGYSVTLPNFTAGALLAA